MYHWQKSIFIYNHSQSILRKPLFEQVSPSPLVQCWWVFKLHHDHAANKSLTHNIGLVRRRWGLIRAILQLWRENLNVEELLAWNRRETQSLSDCIWTRTHNHLVRKRTLNRLAKLAKRLSCCKYLSIRCIWLYVLILSLAHFRVNPHSTVARMSRNSLLKTSAKSKFKWPLLDSNPEAHRARACSF